MLLPRLKNDHLPQLKLNKLQAKIRNQVARKVEEGIYQFEEVECPICENGQKEIIGEKERYGLYCRSNICRGCGLVYTSPRMTQESYNEFYNEEYRKLYVGEEKAAQSFFEMQNRKAKRIYSFLEQKKVITDKPLFVFEVGCGAGGILDYFRKKGHTVKGIDLGEEYVLHGKNTHGLDLGVGALSEQQLDKKPDLVIYSHVLEHVLELNKELEAIKKITTADSFVYIEVPGIKEVHKNYEADILKYFQNAHTFHFSLETLTNLFKKAGFRLLHGNQYVRSIFKYEGNQGTIQSDYKAAKDYLLDIEKKRKLYPFTARGIKANGKRLVLGILDKTRTRRFAKSFRLWLTQK